MQDQVVEGEQGWVLQDVLSRASFRRAAVSGQKFFTVISLHISNIYAKKKGIAKKLILTLRAIMISQEVDLVAGDFNGTEWRYRSKDNFSTVDEAHGGIAKKIFQTIRTIMISQDIDLVAGDFNGTAWRCRSRDNLSTIDEVFSDCALPAPPGPSPLWDLDQTSVDFSNHRVLNVFGKCISMVHSPSHGKRFVYVPPIIVAITKHGLIWTS